MKKTTFLLCSVFMASLFAASLSYAQSSRVYMAGYMGLSKLPDLDLADNSFDGDASFKNNMSFAGALGLRLNYNLRLEGELSYSKNEFINARSGADSHDLTGDMSRLSTMVIGYYDFDVPWSVRPFVSAGMGFHKFKGDLASATLRDDSGDDVTFGWTMGGGMKYRMADDMAVTGSYRYIGSSDVELGSYEMEYSNHEFRVGLEYDLH